MSENKNNTVVKVKTYGGISFVGLLAILFIGLKLTGFINWSWIWILSPLWITPILVISIFIFFVLIGIVVNLIIKFFDEKNNKNKK